MDDVKRAADEYNRMGERAAAAGIMQGLHNEDFELTKVDGKRTYDLLFQFSIPSSSSSSSRSPPSAMATTPPSTSPNTQGRFISMHVQGWSAKTRKIVAGRPGHPGLEQNICRRKNRRH